MRYKHNKHTTFYWVGKVTSQSDGRIELLADYQFESPIRNRGGRVIDSLEVQKDVPEEGWITISADSSEWPEGELMWELTLLKSGIKTATEVVNLTITGGDYVR